MILPWASNGVSLKELLLKGHERMEDYFLADSTRFRVALGRLEEDHAQREGARRAKLAAWRAWRRVPAYRDFLERHGLKSPDVPFDRLPPMTKANYIRAYPTEDRCLDGSFLKTRVAIDESSGSTGQPYDWVRGLAERRRTRIEMARQLGWMFGDAPMVAINAFSMGAWATGVNVGEALEMHGVVKSTGPDIEKVLHTLEFFGPRYAYFICGYPPFLKLVLDAMIEREFPLEQYALHALVGGEGMSEEFRTYMLRHFRSCFSGYGASDLTMGIAGESLESIHVRRLLHAHPELRREVLHGDHRVPMVFQYNPMSHFIEVSPEGELIITLTYSRVLSPRIRYNVGDEGLIWPRKALLERIERSGYAAEMPGSVSMALPYLFLFGRRDYTISIMGANIYPEDVERALHGQRELWPGLASFQISVEDRGNGSVYPRLCVEWICQDVPELPCEALARELENRLAEINTDFAQSRAEYPEAMRLELQVYARGTGPFARCESQIKNRYLGKRA